MGIGVVTIVLGICTLVSFYLTFHAAIDGDSRGDLAFWQLRLSLWDPPFHFGN